MKVATDWRKETHPEICVLMALVHRQAVRGFVPGFFGGLDLAAPIHDGHSAKIKCELRSTEVEDLTPLWKSGKQ